MRYCLLLCLVGGVFSAVIPWWDNRCNKESDAIPCSVVAGRIAGKAQRNDSSGIVVQPHDLRIEPRVKVSPTNGGHSLETVLSWESPTQPREIAKRVTGFQLAIVPLTGTKLNTQYFQFHIPDTIVFTNQFQRFVFTSRGLLLFGESYEIRVWSLPMPISIESDRPAQKVVQMPRNPDARPELQSPRDCRNKSDEDAARWVSGFRRLELSVLQRKLHVSFVAAPPQYCFQQYRLSLTNTRFDETTVLINDDDLVTDHFGNVTVRCGQHDFLGLEPGLNYTVSVIAVERRADDKRCVCPVGAQKKDNLRTGNTVCSCTSAESEPVYLEYYVPPPVPAPSWIPVSNNVTAPPSGESLATGLLFLGMILFTAVLVVGVSMCAIVAYFHHLRLKDRAVRIRFIADRTPHKGDGAQEAALPFIQKNRVVTIVYSHDSVEHELIVEALARFISEQLKYSVLLDAWCENELAQDKAGWIRRSVDVADCVIFVHSIGARLRYDAAFYKECAVERVAVGPLDDIFLPHAYYALQARDRITGHPPSFVHLRCEYTSDANLLPAAMADTVFELPRDAASFVLRMEGAPADSLPSRHWQAVKLGIEATVDKLRDEPDWFERTHCRLPVERRAGAPMGLERSPHNDDSQRRFEEKDATVALTTADACVLIKPEKDTFVVDDRDGSHDSGLAVSIEHSICVH